MQNQFLVDVWKHPAPDILCECVEVADQTAPIPEGAVRMSREELAAWKASEESAGWRPQKVGVELPTIRYIAKDTIFRRIEAAGKLEALQTMLASEQVSELDRFRWQTLVEVNANSVTLRAGLESLGLNPEEILK